MEKNIADLHDNNNFFNINVIVKIFYKYKFFILTITSLFTILSVYLALNLKSYKAEINLYGNDRVLNEMGEQPQFSLNSFEFLNYLTQNSTSLRTLKSDLNENDQEFLETLSSMLKVQSENNNPSIKVIFSNKNKELVETLQTEYPEIAKNYLNEKKVNYFSNQLIPLEQEYKFIKENIDLSTAKDPTIDSLVGRISYYRVLLKDETPLVKLISSTSKSDINKKIIVLSGTLLGLFLSIFISFFREFLKTLDWKNIKN